MQVTLCLLDHQYTDLAFLTGYTVGELKEKPLALAGALLMVLDILLPQEADELVSDIAREVPFETMSHLEAVKRGKA